MLMPIVEAVGVSKTFEVKRGGHPFEVRALDDVSLALEPGRTLGVVGESGSGKSTLGRVISLLLPPGSGEVRVEGVEVRGLDARGRRELRRRFQIVWQNPFGSMNTRDTIETIVTEAPVAHGMLAKRDRRSRAEAILDSVGLPTDLLLKRPQELSGGQLQRVAIGRTLALEPELVVCDEVTSALDVSVQAQILNLLHEVQQRTNVAYLFISHDLQVVRHISDDVVVMYAGRVLEAGDARTVYADPQHPYAEELVRVARADQASELSMTDVPPAEGAPTTGCCYSRICPLREPVCASVRPTLEPGRSGSLVACHVTAPGPAIVAAEPSAHD
jgi:oligopeptide/dipeptide ABC transporter ATP-binding protein